MKIYRPKPYRPWNPKRAEAIRQMRARGMGLREIGAVFGISELRVFHILNPDRIRAHVAVYDAIKSGRLTRPDRCEDCLSRHHKKIEAHHDDYGKPLQVKWLCRPCHIKADMQRKSQAQEAA